MILRKAVLGLSVGSSHVRAVLLERSAVRWAGQVAYADLVELADVIARLAGESGRPVRRVRVVLERAVVQLRSIVPAPPLQPSAARRYVALEATRLFRKNGANLVTDARLVRLDKDRGVLWATAAPEPLVRAVLAGCAQAGLAVEALGPAADVLVLALVGPPGVPEIVLSNDAESEVLSVGPTGTWRSRLVPSPLAPLPSGEGDDKWAPPLATLGAEAGRFAPAYAAAVGVTRLDLLPGDTRAARSRIAQRRVLRVAGVGLVLWLLAGGVYVGRLFSTLHSSMQYLDAVAVSFDSALALRRELAAGRATLETIASADASRSRWLALLGALTAALGDSAFLVTLRVGPDGT
ncbi:MAG: hypothetical protein ACRDH5_01280, partial [bacterium]